MQYGNRANAKERAFCQMGGIFSVSLDIDYRRQAATRNLLGIPIIMDRSS
jgi:hypothetical protein